MHNKPFLIGKNRLVVSTGGGNPSTGGGNGGASLWGNKKKKHKSKKHTFSFDQDEKDIDLCADKAC